jgi:hypothetical protein
MAHRRGKLVSKQHNENTDVGIFLHGDPKSNRLGLYATKRYEEKNLTLGQHLATFQHPKFKPFKKSDERIRNRYLDRMMFIKEFHQIYDKQQQFHNSLNDNLREELGGKPLPHNDGKSGLLFFQRELKRSKSIRVTCSYEKGKKGKPCTPNAHTLRVVNYIKSYFMANGSPHTMTLLDSIFESPLRIFKRPSM